MAVPNVDQSRLLASQEHDTDEELAALANTDFEPLMSQGRVFAIEAAYEKTWGVKRRLVLSVLARSRAQLLQGFARPDDDANDLLELIDHIDEYRVHLKAALELAESANARILCVFGAAIGVGKVGHAS